MVLGLREGIPANSRDVNRSTRQKNSGREQRPEVAEGGHQALPSTDAEKFPLCLLDLFEEFDGFEAAFDVVIEEFA
jgi:hypothetical protein